MSLIFRISNSWLLDDYGMICVYVKKWNMICGYVKSTCFRQWFALKLQERTYTYRGQASTHTQGASKRAHTYTGASAHIHIQGSSKRTHRGQASTHTHTGASNQAHTHIHAATSPHTGASKHTHTQGQARTYTTYNLHQIARDRNFNFDICVVHMFCGWTWAFSACETHTGASKQARTHIHAGTSPHTQGQARTYTYNLHQGCERYECVWTSVKTQVIKWNAEENRTWWELVCLLNWFAWSKQETRSRQKRDRGRKEFLNSEKSCVCHRRRCVVKNARGTGLLV